MDMNILKYRAFIATVESGSFTRASELLNYSQSGISRMIGDLEAEWGITLLERNHSRLALTSDGEVILQHARRICDEYEKLQMELDDLHGLKRGVIRIATFSSVATHWLPLIFKAFCADYPEIRYELLLGDYGEIESWVREGRVDCGFTRLPSKAHFKVQELERDELMAVLPAEHPLSLQEKVSLEELCREPFLLLEKGGRWEITELFEEYRLKPDIRFTTWDDYAIMSMVEKGLGVSILPSLILRRIPYKVAIRPLSVPAFRQIGLIMNEAGHASVALRCFLEYLDLRNEVI